MAKVASYSSYSGSGSVTVDKPVGTSQGDLLLLLVSTNQNDGSYKEINTPSGFTLVTNVRAISITSSINTTLFAKTAGGSEPANYTVSADPSYISGLLLRVTGWDQTYDLSDFATNSYASGSSSATANSVSLPALTLSREGDLILALAAQNSSVTLSATAAGYTFTALGGVGGPNQQALSTQCLSGASFPATTVTPSSSASYQATVAIVLAIPTDRTIAGSFICTAYLGAGSFARLIAVSTLGAALTLGAAIAMAAGRVWSALTKSSSTGWDNQTKS